MRNRERLIRFGWGAARWLALVLALLLVCTLTDYIIDRDRDTPWAVRYILFGVQALAAMLGAIFFLVLPQLRRLRDSELALWVEARTSRLQHRLITAVELNQPGAQIEGMSEQLIAVVTREAEKMSGGIAFPRIADHRRLLWSVAVLVPLGMLLALPLLIWPAVTLTLLARQALLDLEVPRLVRLQDETPKVWPTGEKMQIVYRVSGPVSSDSVGHVIVSPEGQPRDRFELTYWKPGKDGAHLFHVELPPSSADFTHSARLADGRTRTPGHVHFVARPIVEKQEAWVQLPACLGKDADGKRYEQQQGHGDVVGIPGSSVRVTIQAQKPLRGATLELLGPEHHDPQKSDDELGPEIVKDAVPMKLGENGQEAEAVFDLKEALTGYRIVVSDTYGFVNVPAPRRTLRVIPEEPPQVLLLKDYYGMDADSDVEGIPVPLGEAIRIPYAAHGPFGLGMAKAWYRVLPRSTSGNDAVEPGPWTKLPLPEVTTTAKTGPFDPKRGVFHHTGVKDEVPFHAVPSSNPKVLGRQIGGGRVHLHTDGLVDAKGNAIQLKKGDQIEYCVEVFAERVPHSDRATAPAVVSETRVTTIVDRTEWRNWLKAVLREEEHLRKIDADERAVFGPR